MDVEMVGSGVVGVGGEDGFQHGNNFFGPANRVTIHSPVIPSLKVHHGFGEEGPDIGVVWKAFPGFLHGIDFVNNEDDREWLLKEILAMKGGTKHLIPLGSL